MSATGFHDVPPTPKELTLYLAGFVGFITGMVGLSVKACWNDDEPLRRSRSVWRNWAFIITSTLPSKALNLAFIRPE